MSELLYVPLNRPSDPDEAAATGLRYCAVCDVLVFETYMVRRDVWAAAGFALDDEAHLDCLEQRLGRRLTLDDFAPVLCNRALYFGARLAGADVAVPHMPRRLDEEVPHATRE